MHRQLTVDLHRHGWCLQPSQRQCSAAMLQHLVEVLDNRRVSVMARLASSLLNTQPLQLQFQLRLELRALIGVQPIKRPLTSGVSEALDFMDRIQYSIRHNWSLLRASASNSRVVSLSTHHTCRVSHAHDITRTPVDQINVCSA